MRKLVLSALTIGFLAAFAMPASAQEPPQPAEGEEVEFTAQVVDLSCKVVYDLSGDMHRECAQVCADRGVSLGLLDEDGNLWLPVAKSMPGSNGNDQLRPHAEHTVNVKGTAIKRGGMNTIILESVTM